MSKVYKTIIDPVVSPRTLMLFGNKPHCSKMVMTGEVIELAERGGTLFAECRDAIYTLEFSGNVLKESFKDAFNKARSSKA